MDNQPTRWSCEGFCDHFEFVHKKMLDHKFVWVLGAGASAASKIRTGGELVQMWLDELKVQLQTKDEKKLTLEKWATKENLGIKDFKYEEAASSYPQVYERRFRDYPEEGYAYLEDQMAKKDPSPGYSILAKALEDKRHKAVITTNFDNLVADALSIYTKTFPFVCGHESLVSFVRVAMRRPLVCKIHRDLLLGPKNDPRSLKRLHEAWAGALRALLEQYTPIFIGYGGNDGSLMNLLESLEPGEIKGRLIWCYYEKHKPSERIEDLVVQHQGVLVPVPDFDLLMVLLGQRMGIGPLDEVIKQRAEKRTETYQERILKINTADYPDVAKALAATFERAGGWWAWELKAKAETDPTRREIVYRQGVELCPKSAKLLNNYATFMTDERGKHDEAEQHYQRALELEPEFATIIGNYANLLWRVRGKYDEAEQYYRKALQLDPNIATNIGNFAVFMNQVRKGFDEAERLYRRALELDPKHAGYMGNFAAFIWQVRKEHDQGERLFREALEMDPKDPNNTGNYASFIWKVRQNHDEAERLYRKALELDPKHVDNMGNFASFVTRVRKDHDEAERLYRLAIELDPKHVANISNFAIFLAHVREDYHEAERFYRLALELHPQDATSTGDFASFLTNFRKNHEEAERLYSLALELDSKHVNNTANFGAFLLALGRTDDAESMVQRADELNDGERDQVAAELALYRVILGAAAAKDDTAALEQLAGLLDEGFERGSWSFDRVLEFAKAKVSAKDYRLYVVLADAILDTEKVAAAQALLKKRFATPSRPAKKSPKKKKPAKKRAPKKKAAKKKTSKKAPKKKS